MTNVRKRTSVFLRCVFFSLFCQGKIPQPGNVVAVERKSRRTVKLKWTVDGVLNTEPVFYVVEAQWKLTKTNEQETTSKWGFLKEEVSHTKAIIRNIQRDERWYTFRVAAVTRHGYSKFSTTNKPFRLGLESSKTIVSSNNSQ